MGGIIGQSYYGIINVENCVSGGKIVNSKQASGKNYIGSVLGYIGSNADVTNITHCFWTGDVGYDNSCISGTSVTVTDSSLRELNTEAVNELNEYAEKNSTWNKWLLNTNKAQVTFKVNENKDITLSSQLILLPDLAGSDNRVFKGWFTDPGYSTPFTSNEVSGATTLYGLYETVVTVSFDGNGGTLSQQSKSVVFNKTYGPSLKERGLDTPSLGGSLRRKENKKRGSLKKQL